MNKYIILLRSINIAKKNIVKMKDLKEELNKIKQFKNVQTYIQTGNIIIDFDNSEEASKDHHNDKIKINKLLTECLSNKFNIHTNFAIHNIQEYKSIVENNPFDIKILTRSSIFFPCEESINETHYNEQKDEMTETTQWKLINGVIYFLGSIASGSPKEKRVYTQLNKIIKSSPYQYTNRNYNTTNKILELI